MDNRTLTLCSSKQSTTKYICTTAGIVCILVVLALEDREELGRSDAQAHEVLDVLSDEPEPEPALEFERDVPCSQKVEEVAEQPAPTKSLARSQSVLFQDAETREQRLPMVVELATGTVSRRTHSSTRRPAGQGSLTHRELEIRKAIRPATHGAMLKATQRLETLYTGLAGICEQQTTSWRPPPRPLARRKVLPSLTPPPHPGSQSRERGSGGLNRRLGTAQPQTSLVGQAS